MSKKVSRKAMVEALVAQAEDWDLDTLKQWVAGQLGDIYRVARDEEVRRDYQALTGEQPEED